ncbi:MAG: precorrin-4 C(11)-methyltransferase [Deltaproteobacteria bacterium]|nr:precorrin-4 C(11)-methyltransferase [Deltaproteobacteria bacterium]
MTDQPTTLHEVIFVGAGPGDPDLLTVAGRRALEEADLIVAAGSLVSPAVLAIRGPRTETVDSAPLTLEQICGRLVEAHRRGLKVVRLHTGDPSLYGAVHEQFARLKAAGVPYRVIPGVTAATAAAASLGLEFTLPELTQTLIVTRIAGRTPMPEGEELAALAAHRTSLALYLSAGQGPEVQKALVKAYGPTAPAAICWRVGWPEGRAIWTEAGELAETLQAEKIDRHALILIGPAVAALRTGQDAPKSRLYSANFGHAFRDKRP